jgi:para-aminobenzoate synthetase component 1
MGTEAFKRQLSEYATQGEPFFFVIDFECRKPFVCRLTDAAGEGVFYDIKGFSNFTIKNIDKEIVLRSTAVEESIFREKFDNVKKELELGNSYLLNLTFSSEIEINLSLEEIFQKARAPYKLFFKNEFVVFSPECFIKINKGEIFTYPMKGTLDAKVENAVFKLRNNKKEEWEHNTIVDLMRNDLAMIASDIRVSKYRYMERIKTNKNEILQSSSEIKGRLKPHWRKSLGEDIFRLLPAGSISGAPKKKTVEIIRQNELSPRGYYTGIFGFFDGVHLDSAVAIRYIEEKGGKYFYRSGAGITAQSEVEKEYSELIQKIYVPTF